MDRGVLKNIGLCLTLGIAFTIVLYVIALTITNKKGYELNDVLFIEGIICLVISGLSLAGGNSFNSPLRGIGKTNDEFIASTNLILSKIEKDKKYAVRSTSKAGLITVSLLVGGVLTLLLNFII